MMGEGGGIAASVEFALRAFSDLRQVLDDEMKLSPFITFFTELNTILSHLHSKW